MKIYLIAVGTHMPAWVTLGFNDYAQRLTQDVKLQLIEIEAKPRPKNANIAKILTAEAQKIRQAIPKNAYVVGLEVGGQLLSTEALADKMGIWMQNGRDVAILIGGPEGFDPQLVASFDSCISLSRLTFPHPLVRIILSEQIYRAWSILHHHPYHRA